MESRWQIPHGQTLQNTAPADRQLALHASKGAWTKIEAHLDRNRLAQEVIDKERAYKLYLHDTSRDMMKDWKDSIMNVAANKMEERKIKAEELDAERMKIFLENEAKSEIDRKDYVERMRKSLYTRTSYPAKLNTALLYAESVYENDKQVEFKKTLEEHERELEAQYAQKVKEGAVDEKREKQEYLCKQKQKRQERGKMLMEDITRRKEEKLRDKMKRIAIEADQNIKTNIEIEAIEKLRQEQKLETKNFIRKGCDDFRDRQLAIQHKLVKEDDEQEEANEIYKAAVHKIECMKRQRKKEKRDIAERREAEAGGRLFAQGNQKLAMEEQLLQQQIQENNAIADQVLLDKSKRLQMLKEERQEDKRINDKKEEERRRVEEEIIKWEMLQRFKGVEVTNEHNEIRCKKNWEVVLGHKAHLNKQMAEKQEVLEKERLADVAHMAQVQNGLLADDQRYLDYAKEVRDLAESKGRITYPIDKVIEGYKRDMGIILPQDNYRICEDSMKPNRDTDNLVNKVPGRMAHDPNSDPNYKKPIPCKFVMRK